jgi:uncharacterized protein
MIIQSEFKAAWWLPGAHLQTIWPVVKKRHVPLALQRERIELPDGDFLDLDWIRGSSCGPIVILLHGLEGSIHSAYAKGMLRVLQHQGYCPVFLHFRGCSGEPNRLPRAYHSGETADLAYVVNLLAQRYPGTPLAAVGYSLGGNALLKWLGETKHDNPLSCAVAVSVPFLLHQVTDRLRRGFSRIYQRRLLRRLHRKFIEKTHQLSLPFDVDIIKKLRTFNEFDNYITAPLHGFDDAKDYYNSASSRQFLKHITVPTLIVHALNDPFMFPSVLPTDAELSDSVFLEVAKGGGHVGFISGEIPGKGRHWLEERIPAFLQEQPDFLR